MQRVVMAFCASHFFLAGCDNASPPPSPEKQFVAYCDHILANPAEIQKSPNVIEKMLKIFENEVKRNPAGRPEFFENILPIIAKSSPGMAIQFEQYASQALRDEMARLRQESTVGNLVAKEKQIADLEKENVKLRQVVEDQKKETAILKEKVEIKSKKVPVLLNNTWLLTDCLFKIKSEETDEQWEFLLVRQSQTRIKLPPCGYSVQFCYKDGRVYRQSMFIAEPETSDHKETEKHYHAVVVTPE